MAPYAAPNAEIAPSLGRNLSACPTTTGACTATATVNLIEPFTLLDPRGNQVDLRVTKTLRIGRSRLQGNFDVYNLTNANDVPTLRTQFGPLWLQPNSIMAGRLYKFSGRFVF